MTGADEVPYICLLSVSRVLYVYICCVQAELTELIADKAAAIEERERLIAAMINEKEEVARQNRVRLVKMWRSDFLPFGSFITSTSSSRS